MNLPYFCNGYTCGGLFFGLLLYAYYKCSQAGQKYRDFLDHLEDE